LAASAKEMTAIARKILRWILENPELILL